MWNCIWKNVCFKIMYFLFPDCSLCIRKFLSYKTQCPTCCVVSVGFLVWYFSLCLVFIFLANLRSFSLWTMPNNSDHMGKVGCSCIWNSPVSEVLLCQCRQKWMEHQAWALARGCVFNLSQNI